MERAVAVRLNGPKSTAEMKSEDGSPGLPSAKADTLRVWETGTIVAALAARDCRTTAAAATAAIASWRFMGGPFPSGPSQAEPPYFPTIPRVKKNRCDDPCECDG